LILPHPIRFAVQLLARGLRVRWMSAVLAPMVSGVARLRAAGTPRLYSAIGT
jgi:hypothetical protein